MKHMLASVVTVSLLTSAGFGLLAYGENWTLLKSGTGVASLYVDLDSVKTLENGRKAFWLKTVMHYPKEKKPKFQKKEMRLYHSMDCKAKRVYPYTIARGYDGEGTLMDEDKRSLKPKDEKKYSKNVFEIKSGDKVYAAVCGNTPSPAAAKAAPASSDKQPAGN